jgi:hypothetical protein
MPELGFGRRIEEMKEKCQLLGSIGYARTVLGEGSKR